MKRVWVKTGTGMALVPVHDDPDPQRCDASADFGMPTYIIRGTTKGNHGNIHIKQEFAAVNTSKDFRDATQQEAVEKRMHARKRKMARDTRVARRGTKRSDHEIQSTGHVPFNLYTARRQERGQHYWQDEGDAALQRDGLDFPT